jgi:NAD(P)H dehydrogenase (quinone)
VKHAVIFAHPNAHSFTAAMAEGYAGAVEALGHTALRRDLYRMDFDPRLKSTELPFAENWQAAPDAIAERELLKDADVFVLFYPLWLNSPPAILKGYLERVFGVGFAYRGTSQGTTPLLKGRQLLSFSSSGAPLYWLQQTGAFEAIRTLFDSYFAELCGLALLDHVHFGGIVPGAREDFVAARQDDVRNTVKKHFGAIPDAR